MKKSGILGIGVATMDIYVDQNRMYPGGNEYNVACNVKFLGARAGFLGVFANDKAGDILESTLRDCGVDSSYSHHEQGSSGYSLVRLKQDGDRVFLFWTKEGVTDIYPITFTEAELEYVKSFQVVSLGSCASVSLERIKLLHDNGVDICYDFHATYDEAEVKRIAPYAQYAFFSCSHLSQSETKAYLKLAVDCGCQVAVGTSGCEPILAYDGKKFYEQETFKVDSIVDAMGAGDSYIGAFLVNYLQLDGPDRIQQALRKAAKHSATVVMKEGSIGVGYDVNPDRLSEIINLQEKRKDEEREVFLSSLNMFSDDFMEDGRCKFLVEERDNI